MKYKVTIDLVPIMYDIEADTQEMADNMAIDRFFEEKLHDIFKWADITVEEDDDE